MKYFLLYSLIGVLFLFGGCVNNPPLQGDHLFSFEHDMEGWAVKGTDLDNPPVEWSIQRTQEIVRNGNTALKYYLSNLNDAGKIWIERSFDVKSNSLYQVNVKYSFASADCGDLNLWTIITGVIQEPSQSRDDLVYQEDTGNGCQPGTGYKWLEKSYDFTVESNSSGKLYVIIGIWGTWEAPRTYYVDEVQVSFVEK
jgi:hypothetical protein